MVSGSPAAIRSCHATRSSPGHRARSPDARPAGRVFISMKKNSSGRSSGTRWNSTVPAPAYPTLRATAHAASPIACAGCGIQQRRRRLLDDLLMAALQRALALAQVDRRAVAVGQHLHLDMPGAREEPLEQQRVVAERGCCDAAARAATPVAPGRHRARRRSCPCRRRRAGRLDDATGSPPTRQTAMRSASDMPGSPAPGITGTPCRATCALARSLSPIASIAATPRPTKTTPAASHTRARTQRSPRGTRTPDGWPARPCAPRHPTTAAIER